MDTVELLDRLVGFPTVSARSNLDLIEFVRGFLGERGIASSLMHDATGQKANLFATVGPTDRPGILLSAHSDVVPVEGQNWTADPFALTERNGKLFGRGAADMKGFVAVALRAMDIASKRELRAPLHFALSHDEEIGCVGVRSMLAELAKSPPAARLCVVGEPTGMAIALGHKGKIGARATCIGVEGHSALAPRALNAIYLATDFIQALRARQQAIAAGASQDLAFDVPYTTLHAGVIAGGTALNIVPNRAVVTFEIRNIAADLAEAVLDDIRGDAEAICAPHRDRFPQAKIAIDVFNTYPGFDTPANSQAVATMREFLGDTPLMKVPFGTEAGLFAEALGIPTVVCGPGSMDQGHKPDEFIARDQLEACDRLMDRILASLG
jgi:acetylornithine deacetylase